jgi:hypothetical protein
MLDRVASTTSDMRAEHVGRSVQLWGLSGLQLLHTLLLPPGPRGDEHLHPAEPRFLADGRTLIVSTFNCGLYRIADVASENPQVEHIYTFPRDTASNEECSLPVRFERFWVQTVDHTRSLVVLDLADPGRPVLVDELTFDSGAVPHWISIEPGGSRIVLTGGGTLTGRVVLPRIDPESGELSVIEDFADGMMPGLDLNLENWPHGSTGAVRPHGAVFSRR